MLRSLFRSDLLTTFNTFILVGLLSSGIAGCSGDESDQEKDSSSMVDSTQEATTLDDGVLAPPNVGTYPASREEIQKWIDNVDMAAIRKHAWDIWESINSPSGEGESPVWETWYSGHDLFDSTSISGGLGQGDEHHLEIPRQFHHTSSINAAPIPRDLSEHVTAFNRYSPSVARYIWDNRLNRAATYDSINQAFDKANTPVVDRQVQLSKDSTDDRAIVIKPVFQFISATEPTVIAYWDGISPQTTTDMANPTPDTWRQGVVVDPTRKLVPGTTVEMSVNGEPAKPLTVVSIDDFYHFTMSEAEVKAFSAMARESQADLMGDNKGDSASYAKGFEAGVVALLVGMHVTTKEIPNWTWQTFWWGANPDDPDFGADRPKSITGPWAHYNMTVGYFMVNPPGKPGGEPFIGFNPYLETNLKDSVTISEGRRVAWTGVTSNCMTCHRLAARKPNPAGPKPLTPQYQPDGFIDPADSLLFSGYTKLDFLWSMTRAR